MIKSFYLNNKVYYIAGGAAVVFALSYFEPAFFQVAILVLLCLLLAVVIDSILLYSKNGVHASRETTERFSIGDPNKVTLHLKNLYSFPVRLTLIDELPVQFQERNWQRRSKPGSGESSEINYT